MDHGGIIGDGPLVENSREALGYMMQHHNGNAKLNPQRVRELLVLRAEGWSYPKLAREFGVSENTVAKICKGTAWRSVTGGQEVLTDGETQLRQLTTPQPSKEEIEASVARFQKMLAEEEQPQQRETTIPEQYTGTATPEEYAQSMKELVEKAERRRVMSGPPPEPVPTRPAAPPIAAIAANSVAEQLLETLKDESTANASDAGASQGQSIRPLDQGN